MSRKNKLGLTTLLMGVLVVIAIRFLAHSHVDVLSPAGVIGQKERHLMIITTLLGLIVVIPVFILTGWIAWTYREGNKRPTKYSPNWDHSFKLEFIWWALPLAIITLLAVITWKSSHQLDPSRPLSSNQKPIDVQVVALQWKWLFIYPQQNIASVNLVQFPVNTPIDFQITSDAPMNSFWIPKLGGQIYAMSGMSTHLHLMADQAGEFGGSSANISGRGFAGMHFTAKAASQSDFEQWVNKVKKTPTQLTADKYNQLSQPSENQPVSVFNSAMPNLFDAVMLKYMEPNYQIGKTNIPIMPGMDHNAAY